MFAEGKKDLGSNSGPAPNLIACSEFELARLYILRTGQVLFKASLPYESIILIMPLHVNLEQNCLVLTRGVHSGKMTQCSEKPTVAPWGQQA